MTTALAPSPAYKHRPTPTRPFFRASATATTGAGTATSINITIPAGAVIGDYAFLVTACADSNTITTPTGWTLLSPSPMRGTVSGMPGSGNADTSATVSHYVFYKVIASGNPGASVTITINAATDFCASMAVYGGVGVISVGLNAWDCTNTETINSRPVRTPSVYAGPNDLMVGFVSNYAYTSTGLNNSNVTAAPTGRTLRGVASSANNVISFAHCAAIFDGTASNQYENYTIAGGQAHTISSSIALGPVAGVAAEVDTIPASLSGSSVVTYGTSICCDVARPETNTGFSTKTPWPLRIQNAYGNPAQSNNFGMCGSMVVDQCCAAFGTQTVPTQGVGTGGGGSPAAPTYSQMANFTNWKSGHTAPSLVLWDPWGNDWLNEVTTGTARQRLSAALAADALIRLFRSSSVKDYNDSSIAYTGTWSNVTSIGYHGATAADTVGTAKLTTVPGSAVTVTATGTDFDLILVVEDNTANSTIGSTYSVTVDGSTYTLPTRVFAVDTPNSITTQFTPGVTHNQTLATKGGGGLFSANYTIYKFCQMAIPIRGLSAGSHTITITHTGSSGDRLLFNCYLVPATTPPWVVMNGLTPFPDVTYGAYNPGNTTTGYQAKGRASLAIYQDMTNAIAAQFADGRVIPFDPSGIPFVFTANSTPGSGGTGDFQSDGVHGLETWHAIYARQIMRRIRESIAA